MRFFIHAKLRIIILLELDKTNVYDKVLISSIWCIRYYLLVPFSLIKLLNIYFVHRNKKQLQILGDLPIQRTKLLFFGKSLNNFITPNTLK